MRRVTGLLLLLALMAGVAVAADDPPVKKPPVKPPVKKEVPKPEPVKPEKKPEEKVEKPAPPPGVFAIVNADIHPITSGVIRRGTVLVRDGKIAAVGESVDLPEGCPTVDAGGKPLLPGFVAARTTRIGTGRVTGKVADSLDPFDREVELALSAGITTGFVASGRTSAVIKMTAGTLEGMLLEEPAAETLSWAKADGPSRQAVLDRFEGAKKHLAAVKEYEAKKAAGDDKAKKPKLSSSLEPFVRLLRRETPARFVTARTASDVLDCLALVDRFRFRAIIEGAPDAWRVGEEIARRGVRVIDSPRTVVAKDPRAPETTGSTVRSSALLRSKGVRFAIMPPARSRFGAGSGISLGGIVGRDLFTLTFDAARAVSGGLSEEAALAAITIDAAEILGVDDRVGSIEVGKDADLILLSGDPLDYRTWCLKAWVNGRLAYEKAKSRMVSEIPVR